MLAFDSTNNLGLYKPSIDRLIVEVNILLIRNASRLVHLHTL